MSEQERNRIMCGAWAAFGLLSLGVQTYAGLDRLHDLEIEVERGPLAL